MARRVAFAATGLVALLLIWVACGGGAAVFPTKGSAVCDDLAKVERFRYTFGFGIESPKPVGPVDESAGRDYSIKPTVDDYRFELTHSGSFVQPDRFDFELSTPGQPGVRTIQIGGAQWFYLGGTWQAHQNPPAHPEATAAPDPYTPLNVCQAVLSPLDLAAQAGPLETVGSTKARHVHIEGAMVNAAAHIFGGSSDMGRLLKSYNVDLWLSEDDARLVKLEAVSKANYPSGRELSIRLSLEAGSFNDDGIKIEPPA